MKEYKLWVYVEEYDPDETECEDIGDPSCIGIFETLEEAEQYVSHLQEIQQ
ncbi:MAG TPA: hypothetical protein VMW20_07295 [Candidatus Nanoarchaeia archaeon]|nr:hypothetical protein [Candidatus Nanoarchaeia archaeon]